MKTSKTLICLLTGLLVAGLATAQEPPAPLTQAEHEAVVEAISRQLQDHYIFPKLADKMAKSIRKNLKKGQYQDITDVQLFAQRLTADLVAVSDDKHIRVIFDPAAIARQRQAVTPAEEQQLYAELVARNRMNNFGFHQVKVMEGNVGYLDLRSFQGTDYAGDTAVAAMNFLGNTDALIIDLRQNGGGSPQMIQLISSYLFGPEPVHLNTFYRRATERYDQTWTLPM
ncbi:S41 family peptidase [Marinicella meishanensis]|uniref:S41 family peptidase n=1 Tax=Marinicella meishanensis TaxID=2873263 RepID=UPI0021080AA1|nr:S41 family peptidase [Marinicella sp. NBU2979]